MATDRASLNRAGLLVSAVRLSVFTIAWNAVLAAATLTALVLNSTLGWWWADPSAALLIATALAVEGTRVAVRHRFG